MNKRLSIGVFLFLSSVAALLGQRTPSKWVGSWSTSQQIPEAQNSLAPEDLRNATLRQIVHLSLGGQSLRVHVSNAFGTTPLHLSAVHIARPIPPSSPVIDPASDRALTFHGSAEVTIPAGAEFISDALDFPLAAFADLAISIH